MQKKNDYSKLILDVLLDKEIINEELYEKCSKPHISDLPHDLRTNDVDKLQERIDECFKQIQRQEQIIKVNQEAIDDTYKYQINPLKKKNENYEEKINETDDDKKKQSLQKRIDKNNKKIEEYEKDIQEFQKNIDSSRKLIDDYEDAMQKASDKQSSLIDGGAKVPYLRPDEEMNSPHLV